VQRLFVDTARHRLYSASWDNTARVWDIDTKAQLAVLQHDAWVNGVCVMEAPASIVTSNENGCVTFWHDTEYSVIDQVSPSHGSVVALCSWEDVALCSVFNVAYAISPYTMTVVREYRGHEDDINFIVVNDGLMYTGSDDTNIFVWEIPLPRLYVSCKSFRSDSFDDDPCADVVFVQRRQNNSVVGMLHWKLCARIARPHEIDS